MSKTKQMSLRLNTGVHEDLSFICKAFAVDMPALIHLMISDRLAEYYERAIVQNARMIALKTPIDTQAK